MTRPEPPPLQYDSGSAAGDIDQGAPIGIFDSGLGGLSVWREIAHHLPAENTVYFADQGHVPYGPRSLDEIRTFSHAITEYLLSEGAKIIVVACNTASGAALHYLRACFPDIPFVGMEPAIKPAAEQSRRGVIGVLATPTTFQGVLFRRLVDRFGQQVDIHTQVCPGLVEAVEAGALTTPDTQALLQACLTPLVEEGIDQLVLGCTHYPFLRGTIETILGPSVTVIDPAPAVALQTGRVLQHRGLLNNTDGPGTHHFSTSGPVDETRKMARALAAYTGQVTAAFWSGAEIQSAHDGGHRQGNLTREYGSLYSRIDDSAPPTRIVRH